MAIRKWGTRAAHITEITRTIRFKLLASLLMLLGFSIGVSLIGLWSYERDRYTDMAKDEAMRAGQAVEKSLRRGMQENDWEMIRRTVSDIYAVSKPSNISILTLAGTIVVSGDPALVGKKFDFNQDRACVPCHVRPGILPFQEAVFLESANEKVLRNVIKIVNAEECHACHDPRHRNLGILIYDSPFGKIFAMLRGILVRIILTGLVTFGVLVTILSLILRRYIHRPLRQLEQAFMRAGQGDFNHWVEVGIEGEFQDMAGQFNVMNQALRRMFTEIGRKNWETEQLYAFVRQLSREAEWHKLRRVIIELLLETFKAEKVVLFLRLEKQGSEQIEISWREAGDRRFQRREYPRPPPAGVLPTWVDEAWQGWLDLPERATSFNQNNTIAMVGLTTRTTSLGLICMHRQVAHSFQEIEKKLLTAVREQIEVALANAWLYRLAITDGLTGLYSKRYCETMIAKFIESCELDSSRNFSVLMLDLDHFKQVNDTYGHPVGDDVLIQLADLIREHVRQDDIPCRYGGEEFIILLAGGPRAAKDIATRLCPAVDRHVFLCRGGLEIHCTISIGGASFPDHGHTAAKVIAAADRALYAAKKAGRNRVNVLQ